MRLIPYTPTRVPMVNTGGVLIPRDTYSTSQNTGWMRNEYYSGLLIFFHIFARPMDGEAPATSRITFLLEVQNPGGDFNALNDQSFVQFDELSTNSITLGHHVLMYYPGCEDKSPTPKGHLHIQPVAVPDYWRVRVNITNDQGWEYSVAYRTLM